MESDDRVSLNTRHLSNLDNTSNLIEIEREAESLFEQLSRDESSVIDYVKSELLAKDVFDIHDFRLLLYYTLRSLFRLTSGMSNQLEEWSVLGKWQNAFALMIELGEEKTLRPGGGNPLVHVLKESLESDCDIEPIRKVWRTIQDPRHRWFAYISLHLAEGLFFESYALDRHRSSFSITPK